MTWARWRTGLALTPDFSVTNCAPKLAAPPVPFDMLMLITVVDGDPLGITAIGEVLRVALTKNLLKVSGPEYPCTVGPLAGSPKLEKKKSVPLN